MEDVQEATLVEAIRRATSRSSSCRCSSAPPTRTRASSACRRRRRVPPNPREVAYEAGRPSRHEAKVVIPCEPTGPMLAFAFSSRTGSGQLTYLRGLLRHAQARRHHRQRPLGLKKVKVGRLVRHARERDGGHRGLLRGDIVGLFGSDCYWGDTFHEGSVDYAMSSMHVPAASSNLTDQAEVLGEREQHVEGAPPASRRDPTFRVSSDPEPATPSSSGMASCTSTSTSSA